MIPIHVPVDAAAWASHEHGINIIIIWAKALQTSCSFITPLTFKLSACVGKKIEDKSATCPEETTELRVLESSDMPDMEVMWPEAVATAKKIKYYLFQVALCQPRFLA